MKTVYEQAVLSEKKSRHECEKIFSQLSDQKKKYQQVNSELNSADNLIKTSIDIIHKRKFLEQLEKQINEAELIYSTLCARWQEQLNKAKKLEKIFEKHQNEQVALRERSDQIINDEVGTRFQTVEET